MGREIGQTYYVRIGILVLGADDCERIHAVLNASP